MRVFIFSVMVGFFSIPALAVLPSEILKDPEMELRARDISKGLRCLVCQNQSIDDSDATLARDLRVLVRDRLVAGDTNDQVVEYVVSRYGDFVLLNPPFKTSTLVLWLGPFIFLFIGLIAAFVLLRKRKNRTVVGGAVVLSSEEELKLKMLLKENDT